MPRSAAAAVPRSRRAHHFAAQVARRRRDGGHELGLGHIAVAVHAADLLDQVLLEAHVLGGARGGHRHRPGIARGVLDAESQPAERRGDGVVVHVEAQDRAQPRGSQRHRASRVGPLARVPGRTRQAQVRARRAQEVHRVRRGHGFDGRSDGLRHRNVLACYTHLHALGSEGWAPALVHAATRYHSAAGAAELEVGDMHVPD